MGGGGHAAAASAIVKDVPLATARRRVVAALKRSRAAAPTAAGLMSRAGALGDGADTTVDAARITCERYGYGGLSVADGETLVGSVSRRDLDRAVRHKLGHAPVKAVMTTATTVVAADTAARRAHQRAGARPGGPRASSCARRVASRCARATWSAW